MTVKADSKGRLTGAQPETRYLKRTDPDGTITYVPEVPSDYDSVRDVTPDQFQEFFGVHPSFVCADYGIQVAQNIRHEGGTPYGIAVTQFGVDDEGRRIYVGGSALKVRTLIRIRKEEA